MLAITPNNIYLVSLTSAAVLSLIVTLPIVFKWKIPNASFSLIRALATFAFIWLLWGSLSGSMNFKEATDQAGYVQLGFFKYLTVQFLPTTQQSWLASAELELTSLIFTLITSLLAAFGFSFILSRLAAISDRRR